MHFPPLQPIFPQHSQNFPQKVLNHNPHHRERTYNLLGFRRIFAKPHQAHAISLLVFVICVEGNNLFALIEQKSHNFFQQILKIQRLHPGIFPRPVQNGLILPNRELVLLAPNELVGFQRFNVVLILEKGHVGFQIRLLKLLFIDDLICLTLRLAFVIVLQHLLSNLLKQR